MAPKYLSNCKRWEESINRPAIGYHALQVSECMYSHHPESFKIPTEDLLGWPAKLDNLPQKTVVAAPYFITYWPTFKHLPLAHSVLCNLH